MLSLREGLEKYGRHLVFLWQYVEVVPEYDSQIYFCTDDGKYYLYEEYFDDDTYEFSQIAFLKTYFERYSDYYQESLTWARNEVLTKPSDYPNAILPPKTISGIPTERGYDKDGFGITYIKTF